MPNYSYVAEFEHGSAQGEVLAEKPAEAKAKAKAMYEGQSRDTGIDKDGNPTFETTVVTNVKVTEIKE